MTALRVLLVSHTYFPSSYRGKLRLLAARPDIDLCLAAVPAMSTTMGALSYEQDSADTYRQAMLPSLFASHNILRTYWPHIVARLIRDLRPDIVHVEAEPHSVALSQFAMLKHTAGYKLVFFTWENIYRRMPLPFRLLERFSLSRADAALAGNQEAVDVLGRRGFGKRIDVVPQVGVDPQHSLEAAPVPEYDRRASGFVVGFAGRLVPEKGVLDLVEAFARLAAPAQLLLVGSGALAEKLGQRCADLGIRSRVIFAGNVAFRDVPRFLKCMDVLVLPSRTMLTWKEQFGHVLAEAMACGVPVIGSSSGAIPDVVGDAGVIFPEGDVVALVQSLQRLTDMPSLRAELGAKGQRRAASMFSDDAIARKTYQFYRTLCPST